MTVRLHRWIPGKTRSTRIPCWRLEKELIQQGVDSRASAPVSRGMPWQRQRRTRGWELTAAPCLRR